MDTITINNTAITLSLGNIIHQITEALVNATDSSLRGGIGVDAAIHGIGDPEVLAGCKKIVADHGPLQTGKAVITTAGKLPAKCVIHTVGPIWYGGKHHEAEDLANTYIESLKLATMHGLQSISFPSVSTGEYRYPLNQAAKIALETIADYLRKNKTTLREVRFVLYDLVTYKAYAKALRNIDTTSSRVLAS